MGIHMKLPDIKLQLTKEQRKYVVAGLLFAGTFFFIYWKFFWTPLGKRIEETQKKLTEEQSRLDKAKMKANKLRELEISLAQLKEAVQLAEKRLPKTKDVANLFDTFQQTAMRHRIDVQSFQPQGVQSKEYFIELPFQITFSGSYHDLARFLAALGILERIVSTRNISLNPLGGRKPGVTLNGTFTLVAYQYKG